MLYVDSLIGADTINTMPPATLQLFEDHGTVRATLPADAREANRIMDRLAAGGVDFADVTRVLEDEGIEKFAKSFETLLGVIRTKRQMLAAHAPPRHSAVFHGIDAAIAVRLDAMDEARIPRRIWSRDPTVWKSDPGTPEIRDRLGWLTVGDAMARQVEDLAAFADEARKAFSRVILCGMGGSSLAPEVLRRTFGTAHGYPPLLVLDSTDPEAVRQAGESGDIAKTLFLISSKSGTTQESDSFFRHFWDATGARGSQFVAITDPGTPLEALAGQRRFRRTFLNPPDIGGRYSALSYFGLVPASLLGVDLKTLLHRAHRMAEACSADVPALRNPAAWLGAILGEGARAGRDKLTFVLSPGIASFGSWAEQLIAESTGKEGKGILPVVDEPLGAPGVYGDDRVFVSMVLDGEADAEVESRLTALESAGHPVVHVRLEDRYDLGQEFFRWEFATAVAGAVLEINPFDQPNVAESKANTKAVLATHSPPSAAASAAELDAFLSAVEPAHYLAIMAYLPPTAENDARLASIRSRLRDRLRVATTLGYGPRFLHSTGQLHKGGPPVGHFLQVTESAKADLPIPGELFSVRPAGGRTGRRRPARPAGSEPPRHSDRRPRSARAVSVTHIFFDIGGVLGSNGWDREQRAAAVRHFGLEPEELEDRHVESVAILEQGRMTLDEYLQCAVFHRPRPFTVEEFKAYMLAQSVPFPETIAVARALARTGRYRLMTINNESAELNQHRLVHFGLRDIFVAFFTSCWVGVLKPAHRIYQVALAMSQACPEQLGVHRRPGPQSGAGPQSRHANHSDLPTPPGCARSWPSSGCSL